MIDTPFINMDFEDWGPFTGWEVGFSGAPTGGYVSQETTIVYHGLSSMKMSITGSSVSYWAKQERDISHYAGKQITVSIWRYGVDLSASGYMRLGVKDNLSAYTYSQSNAVGSWIQASVVYNINPAATTLTIELVVHRGSPAGTNYGYWDYAQITCPTCGPYTPGVTTDSISGITDTTALGHGTITDTGQLPDGVLARGICWNTTGNPTIADAHSDVGPGILGAFEAPITGLSPLTHYYARAYATGSDGTAYGSVVTFTTTPPFPAIQTLDPSNVTTNTARMNALVVEDSGISCQVKFEYGTTSAYGMSTLWLPSGFHAGDLPYYDLNNIGAGSVMHYRAVIRNKHAVTYGNDVIITTPTPIGEMTGMDSLYVLALGE